MEEQEARMDIGDVMRKVQKALQLAENAGTEAEAEAATGHVQRLMLKYNLDMAQVQAQNPNNTAIAGQERVKEHSKASAMYKWQQKLAKYVAHANFCYYLTDKKLAKNSEGKTRYKKGGSPILVPVHVFVGRRANVTTAQLMFQYLCHTIEQRVPLSNNAERLSRSAMSWKEGCADRLSERLYQRRKKLSQEHDQAVAKAAALAEAKQAALNPRHPTAAEIISGLQAKAQEATGMRSDSPESQPTRPAGASEDWLPGSNLEPEAPASTSTAMVLASEFGQAESDANWEFANGMESGYLARSRVEREQRWAKEAEQAEAKSENERPKSETEQKEAARRRAADTKKWQRQEESRATKERNAWLKRDHNAYRDGVNVGSNIGLDTQVTAGSEHKKLGK